jgi:hypothetical protein
MWSDSYTWGSTTSWRNSVRIPNFNNNDLASSPEWRNEAFEICKSEDWDEKCGVEGVLGPRRINFLVVGKVIRDKKMTDMDMDSTLGRVGSRISRILGSCRLRIRAYSSFTGPPGNCKSRCLCNLCCRRLPPSYARLHFNRSYSETSNLRKECCGLLEVLDCL